MPGQTLNFIRMENKMTLHRALSELKLIDAKIAKTIESIEPSGISQKGKLVNNYYTNDDFEKSAKSNLQSVLDLIKRKSQLKSAIVNANSVTSMKVAGEEMTIAEAINMKQAIVAKKLLVQSIERKHNNAKAIAEKSNKQVEDNALRLASAALQKDNVKINEGDAVAITEPYLEKNLFSVVDPLDAENLVKKLSDEISDFESDVDSALSEINALTYITI